MEGWSGGLVFLSRTQSPAVECRREPGSFISPMSARVRFLHDLKTAALLSGCTGILGAIAVPFLLSSVYEFLPPEQRELPLPLPAFCLVLAVQIFVVYGLLALAGLRLTRSRGREPAPFLTAIWTGRRPHPRVARSTLAFVTGLGCGIVLVAAIAAIGRYFPQSLPASLHPPSLVGALMASAVASFAEEILCRLFLLGALLRILPASRMGISIAILTSSLLFGALHAPSAIFLFGGLANVPLLSWVWMIGLNAFVGVACAVWYFRAGIGGAILVHAGTDLVWHVLSQV